VPANNEYDGFRDFLVGQNCCDDYSFYFFKLATEKQKEIGMKDRQYRKKAILLCGESDGTVFKRTFVIVKKLSESDSSICYEAITEIVAEAY
jgi:hypothetical protein